MPFERKGKQFRIRVSSPKKFTKTSFRTLDVGMKGGLQLIRAKKKGSKKFSTQSIRVSTTDFRMAKGKLIAKTSRGKSQVSSLKKAKKPAVQRVVKATFVFK